MESIVRERRRHITKNPKNTTSISSACNFSSTERLHFDPILSDAKIEQLLLHCAHKAFWPTDEVLGLRIFQEEIFRAIKCFHLHAADMVVVNAFHVLLLFGCADEEGARDIAVLLGCISDVIAESLH